MVPGGSGDVVVMRSPLPPITRVKVAVAVCCAAETAESVTVTPKVVEPAAVGVPLRTPALDRAIPAGKFPLLRLQVYGVVPPAAWKVMEYATPTVPGVSGEVVVIVNDPLAVITSVNCVLAMWGMGEAESVAVTLKLVDPAAAGVPLMTPALDRVKPVGR